MNGYIDILKTSVLGSGNALFGDRIMAYITPKTVEIDLREDFEFLEYKIHRCNNHVLTRYLMKNYKPYSK